jgi:phage regulator Rha-like protein
MSEATNLYAVKSVIRIIRNQRVILDSDLAKLYGVTTKALNQAIKRNADKFPADFMFQLDSKEVRDLLRFGSDEKSYPNGNEDVINSRSQIVTLNSQHSAKQSVMTYAPENIGKKQQGQNIKYPPFVFTEHGATMAAMVLNSSKATAMSVFIVRTFIRMREQLMTTVSNAKRLAEIEKTLLTPSKNCLIALLPYCLISTSAFRVRRSALSVPPLRIRLRRTGQTLNSQRLTLNSQFINVRSPSHA